MRITRVVVLCAFAAVACARPLPPPGGTEDRLPPRLIGTVPEALTVVPANGDAIVFQFDERLSERGFSEALVTVSPLDGALRVERSGSEVRVGIDGGWRADRVYRVVLLPGIRDLFGNERKQAAEIVFSTGPPVQNTAIAGIVLDRVTGRAAQNPVITAVRRADSAAYMAVGDTGGFFALRHLPLGTYDVLAFSDQNRNRRLEWLEPREEGPPTTLGTEADTITRVFRVLSADTTAPVPVTVEVVDSLRLRVTLDDYLSETPDLSSVAVAVLSATDSVQVAQAARVVTAAVFAAEREAAAAARRDGAADSTSVDSASVDTANARAPARAPARAAPAGRSTPSRAGNAATQQAPTGPLPSREIIVVLDRVLPAGRYILQVSGITNISGITGGGTARFEIAARPAAAPAGAAPAAVPPPDSSGAARAADGVRVVPARMVRRP